MRLSTGLCICMADVLDTLPTCEYLQVLIVFFSESDMFWTRFNMYLTRIFLGFFFFLFILGKIISLYNIQIVCVCVWKYLFIYVLNVPRMCPCPSFCKNRVSVYPCHVVHIGIAKFHALDLLKNIACPKRLCMLEGFFFLFHSVLSRLSIYLV